MGNTNSSGGGGSQGVGILILCRILPVISRRFRRRMGRRKLSHDRLVLAIVGHTHDAAAGIASPRADTSSARSAPFCATTIRRMGGGTSRCPPSEFCEDDVYLDGLASKARWPLRHKTHRQHRSRMRQAPLCRVPAYRDHGVPPGRRCCQRQRGEHTSQMYLRRPPDQDAIHRHCQHVATNGLIACVNQPTITSSFPQQNASAFGATVCAQQRICHHGGWCLYHCEPGIRQRS